MRFFECISGEWVNAHYVVKAAELEVEEHGVCVVVELTNGEVKALKDPLSVSHFRHLIEG